MAQIEPPTRKSVLEVIGWNIGTMKNIKKPIALQLRDLGADVLCLQ
jgi:hypothetical protein